MTFGQRLKKYRKQRELTQMELAEAIGVSMQAVSKWETDTGMPDISQIVPLARELNISSDVLLGIIEDDEDMEFEELYEKCLEAEHVAACNWPPRAEVVEPAFRMMYEYFSAHPNHPRAAKYLLDQTELYWGKFSFFENEAATVKECERFANCVFRHSDDADLHSETRFLIASVWARVGQTEKADEALAKMPFRYGDRCYFSAEVAEKAGDYEKAEALCRESFTHKARFVSRCVRLMAGLPTRTIEERVEYEEYMLRLINAFLTGGDYMPHRQIYQKMALVSGLIKWHLKLGNIERAVEHFWDLIETGERYIAFLDGGAKGKSLLLLDDKLDMQEKDRDMSKRYELVVECLRRAVYYGEHIKEAEGNAEIAACIAKATEIGKKFL